MTDDALMHLNMTGVCFLVAPPLTGLWVILNPQQLA